MTMILTPYDMARVCHEANRALQAAYANPNITVSPPWAEIDTKDQLNVIHGVHAAIAGADPRKLHDEWCKMKLAEGWVYGKEKNPIRRTHPCLTMYDALSHEDKLKDILFQAIVTALS